MPIADGWRQRRAGTCIWGMHERFGLHRSVPERLVAAWCYETKISIAIVANLNLSLT